MALTFKPKYIVAGHAIDITLNNLVSSAGAARESAVFDNTTYRYSRARLFLKVTIPNSGTIANDKCCYTYWYPVLPNNAQTAMYPTPLAGLNADVASIQEDKLNYLGTLGITSINSVFASGKFFIAEMPAKIGIVVRNYCGVVFHSSGCEMYLVGENDEAL